MQIFGRRGRQLALLAPLLIALTSACSAESARDISAPDAYSEAAAGRLTIIDIRTPEEWRQTGIGQGVQRVPMIHPRGAEGFIADVLARVGGDKSAPLGLICRTGNRTTQVQRFLEENGFTNVYNIKEGMAGSQAGPGWVQRGLPVEPCRFC
jgi:rhodanese-related sulfurtransferase